MLWLAFALVGHCVEKKDTTSKPTQISVYENLKQGAN